MESLELPLPTRSQLVQLHNSTVMQQLAFHNPENVCVGTCVLSMMYTGDEMDQDQDTRQTEATKKLQENDEFPMEQQRGIATGAETGESELRQASTEDQGPSVDGGHGDAGDAVANHAGRGMFADKEEEEGAKAPASWRVTTAGGATGGGGGKAARGSVAGKLQGAAHVLRLARAGFVSRGFEV